MLEGLRPLCALTSLLSNAPALGEIKIKKFNLADKGIKVTKHTVESQLNSTTRWKCSVQSLKGRSRECYCYESLAYNIN